MILLLVTSSDRHAVRISETQEPFTEMRERLGNIRGGIWAERFECDRVARHWMDIHALRTREIMFGVMRRSETDPSLACCFDGVPVEISDEDV